MTPEEQIADLREALLGQAVQLGMLAQVVRATFVIADLPNVGRQLTWEGMFLESAHYLAKLPGTDPRARAFLEALGKDAPLKVMPHIPRPDLHVVR